MQNNKRHPKVRATSGHIAFSNRVTPPAPLTEEEEKEMIDLMEFC